MFKKKIFILSSLRRPTSGSFVKPSKVDVGIDIWTAIQEKYFAKHEFTNSDDQNQDQLMYNNFKSVFVF